MRHQIQLGEALRQHQRMIVASSSAPVVQRANFAPCLKAASLWRNSSVSDTPIFSRVERSVGQVPSPTPMIGTFGDSISVTEKPGLHPPLMTRGNNARGQPSGGSAADDDDSLNGLSHTQIIPRPRATLHSFD